MRLDCIGVSIGEAIEDCRSYARPFDAHHLLLLTQDGTKLAVHRFQAQPGDPEYLPPGDPLEP